MHYLALSTPNNTMLLCKGKALIRSRKLNRSLTPVSYPKSIFARKLLLES